MYHRRKYGVTVDIGTTNIVIHLVRLDDYHLVNQFLIKNPQLAYGLDIISRIKLAQELDGVREKLVHDIRVTINRSIDGMMKEKGIPPNTVSEVVIVGNTVMHHLFFDLPTDSLLIPPYVTDNRQSKIVPATIVGLDAIPNANVYSPPVVGSFIGPDAIAVLLASSFLDNKQRCMTIDIGTNTEVSIITQQGIWIASAASGPAFEGMAIQCGMGGERGAIKAVSINPQTFKPTLSIIDDTQPRGICGTGAVSLLASLLETGILLPRGSFNQEMQSEWTSFDSDIAHFVLDTGGRSIGRDDIILSQPDVRLLQQSKAAIRAVIDLLLQQSCTTPDNIDRIFLTGAFGSDLQLEDAYRIGLFPSFTNAKITQSRNGAIHGADLLLMLEHREKVEQLVKELQYVELMENDEFNELFTRSFEFPSR